MRQFCLAYGLRPFSSLHLDWKLKTKGEGTLPLPKFTKARREDEMLPYKWPLSQGLSQYNTMTIYP